MLIEKWRSAIAVRASVVGIVTVELWYLYERHSQSRQGCGHLLPETVLYPDLFYQRGVYTGKWDVKVRSGRIWLYSVFRAHVGLGLQLVYYFQFREYGCTSWNNSPRSFGYVPFKHKIQLSLSTYKLVMYALGHNCNWRSPLRILTPLANGLYDNHIDDPTKKINWTSWMTHSCQAITEIDIKDDRYLSILKPPSRSALWTE